MSFAFGNTLRVQLFGQSHSEAIGCVIEGLPAGLGIDLDELQRFLDTRAPGRSSWSTSRSEADVPHIVSGLNACGLTCGTPLAAFQQNTNVRSADYEDLRVHPRPGHADLTAWHKWGEHHDIAGGGSFSARITAPLCVAGGIAMQVLASRGVRVAAHVLQVGNVRDEAFCTRQNTTASLQALKSQMDLLDSLDDSGFPAIDRDAAKRMTALIAEVRTAGDSVGGVVECVATGMPAGVGDPRYDGIQGAIARVVFGIPAVKGLEFGAGFEVATLRGSQNNDCYEMRDGQPTPTTNNAGGSLGGISTGAPVVFRMAVKPTPSIALPQRTVDLARGEAATLAIRGRHDPCVAPRAVPVARAAMALALLDSWLSYPAIRERASL